MACDAGMKAPIAALLCVLLVSLLSGSHASQADEAAVRFVYDDLRAFAQAHRSIVAGTPALEAFQQYVASASPAFAFYARRYGATAESIAGQYAQRPKYYAYVAALEPKLRELESTIAAGVRELSSLTGIREAPPVFYLVANQTAGGTPAELDAAGTLGVAVGLDALAISPEVDLSEFPAGIGGRGRLADLPQVVVHETVHLQQVKAQGGLDNYRSIYRPGEANSNLAVAIREGFAEYATWLAAGARLGDRHLYGEAHERELWAAFRPVMHDKAFSTPGWFGAPDAAHPDWPPQIGYWLGLAMCEHYHRSSTDPAGAWRELMSAYRRAELDKIAAAYERKFSGDAAN